MYHQAAIIPATELPAPVTMNKWAGRGDGLFVTLRLGAGEKGLFLFDTGCRAVVIDKSTQPELGKRLDNARMGNWLAESSGGVYRAPKLYLGRVQLVLSSNIITADLAKLKPSTGRLVMGVLGVDCLRNYCIQLDFSAGKIRFLDDNNLDKRALGNAFPLIARNDGRFNIRDNLVGREGPSSLIDTGCGFDGWLAPELYREWTNQDSLATVGAVHSPNGLLGGVIYTDIKPKIIPGADPSDDQHNGIGLRFLARNLVTLDFPKRVMYLKQTSVDPLVDKNREPRSISWAN